MIQIKDVIDSARREIELFESTTALISNEEIANGFSKNENEDTLTHLLVSFFIEKIEEMYRPFKNKKSVVVNELPREREEKCTESFLVLLKKLVELGLLSNDTNAQGKKPLDLLRERYIPYCGFCIGTKYIEQKLLPLFERSNFIYPGRKYVTDLHLYRNSKKPEKICQIPDRIPSLDEVDGANLTMHQRMTVYESYLSQRGYLNRTTNSVIANIGFIVSDKAQSDLTHKPIFVTFPIFYNNYMLYAEKSKNGTHSEDGCIDCLNSKQFILELLKQLNTVQGRKIYALVLDIHSTAEICYDCQSKLHVLQYSNGDFLSKFKKFAEKPKNFNSNRYGYSFILPSKSDLKLIVRVSGLTNPGYNGNLSGSIPRAVVWKNAEKDIKKHPPVLMLHLPPSYFKFQCTSFVVDNSQLLGHNAALRKMYHVAYPTDGHEGNEQMKQVQEEAFKNYWQGIKDLTIKNCTQNKLTLFYQTAFSNTGGKATSYTQTSGSLSQKFTVNVEKSQEIFKKTFLL